MDEKTVEQIAKEERLAYFRDWRAKNKDKVKKHNAAYWANRAVKKLKSNQGAD